MRQTARLPAFASRFNDFFHPMKDGDGPRTAKGVVTRGSRTPRFRISSETYKRWRRIKYFDWDQTRTEQGTWPTKTFVNMWFKNETNLSTMIGLLEIVEEEIKRKPNKLSGQGGLGKIGNEPEKEAFGKGPCVVSQRSQRSWRK